MRDREDRTTSATVVLAHRVRPGMEQAFEAWQDGISAAARAFPGFEATEVVRPVAGVQDEYVIVYRFDGAETLRRWLDSSERATWLSRGAPLLEAAPVQHTIATPRPSTVTVVVTHRVKQGAEARYRAWQRDIDAAVRRFEGFVSTEVFEPSGEQPDWVVVFRFDDAAHLQAWLDSEERARCLDLAAPLLDGWDLHRISGGLGGWFQANGDPATTRTPPRWKQAAVVLLALYPTVMTLRLLLTPRLSDLPSAVTVLLGNVLSVAALTWLLMPPLTRALGWWLDPRASARATSLGALTIATLVALMTAMFS